MVLRYEHTKHNSNPHGVMILWDTCNDKTAVTCKTSVMLHVWIMPVGEYILYGIHICTMLGWSGDVKKQDVHDIASKNTILNRGSNSDGFLGVDTFRWILPKYALHSFPNPKHMGHIKPCICHACCISHLRHWCHPYMLGSKWHDCPQHSHDLRNHTYSQPTFVSLGMDISTVKDTTKHCWGLNATPTWTRC